eukprot:scaffold90305_cov14-Tisochrysis_lutea.AAC.1
MDSSVRGCLWLLRLRECPCIRLSLLCPASPERSLCIDLGKQFHLCMLCDIHFARAYRRQTIFPQSQDCEVSLRHTQFFVARYLTAR